MQRSRHPPQRRCPCIPGQLGLADRPPSDLINTASIPPTLAGATHGQTTTKKVTISPTTTPTGAAPVETTIRTDHGSHREQASMIRRYIAWRNRNAHDRRLGEIINRANVA
jgi:hypothetical protein